MNEQNQSIRSVAQGVLDGTATPGPAGSGTPPSNQPEGNAGTPPAGSPTGQTPPAGGGNAGNAGDTVNLENVDTLIQTHPELAPFAKSLQGDYTKKLQEISSIKNRADALTEILEDPEINALISRKFNIGGATPPPAGSQNNQTGSTPLDSINMDDISDPNVKAMIEQSRAQQAEIQRLRDTLAAQAGDKEIESLKSDEMFADIDEKMPELIPLLKNGYSLKAAYIEKFGRDYLDRKIAEAAQSAQAANQEGVSSTTLPPAGGGSVPPTPAKADEKPANVRSAINSALQEINSRS